KPVRKDDAVVTLTFAPRPVDRPTITAAAIPSLLARSEFLWRSPPGTRTVYPAALTAVPVQRAVGPRQYGSSLGAAPVQHQPIRPAIADHQTREQKARTAEPGRYRWPGQ